MACQFDLGMKLTERRQGGNHIHIRSSHTVLGLMPLIPYSDLIYTAKVTHASFLHKMKEPVSV